MNIRLTVGAVIFTCITVVSLWPEISLGQQEEMVKIDRSDIDFARYWLNQRIQRVIDDVHQCSDLTEDQKNRLGVSKKGAVAKQIQSFESIAMAVAKLPQSSGLDDDSIVALLGEPENKPFWKKALKTILTHEQLEKYEAIQVERDAELRAQVVNRFVERFAGRLKMSQEQHRRVSELIDQNFGCRILEKARHHKDCMIEVGPGFAAMLGDKIGEDPNLPTPITRAQLTDFLNADQVATWEKRVQPNLENLTKLRYYEGGLLALIATVNEQGGAGAFTAPRPGN